MPFYTPQYPWLDVDHNGKITCTRCGKARRFNKIGGLEDLMDTLQPFARQHKLCQEPKTASQEAPPEPRDDYGGSAYA